MASSAWIRRLIRPVAIAALVAACGTALGPGPTPTPGQALTMPELKLAMIERFGALWYCDPDFWPIQRQDELAAARERWPELLADTAAAAALGEALQIDVASANLTDDQRLAVYRAWKLLNAIGLEPIGNDRYRFDYLAQPAAGAAEGTRTAGTIAVDGTITVEQQTAAGEPVCPICLAAGTRIETPAGPAPVEALRIGDTVWTLDPGGRRVPGLVVAVGSTAAPASHHVVRLVLADGRTVTASPGHPLADGRLLGQIEPGDSVDGSAVVSAESIPYGAARTYDIAVSGATGVYFVNGIPLGSTLRP
jgi:hypothetical protein